MRNVIIPEKFKLLEGEPYVYELENVTKGHIREGKKYIGSHDGSQGWDYNSHGTNEDLKSDIANGHIRKEILFLHQALDKVREVEGELLKKVNAGDNPKYYNKNNGIGLIKNLPNIELASKYAKSILDTGSFLNVKETVVEVKKVKGKIPDTHFLMNLVHWQTRDVKLFPDHVTDIAYLFHSYGGDLDAIEKDREMQFRIVVLQNRLDEKTGNKQDRLIGGNHTLTAMKKEPAFTRVRVLMIPEEIHKDWQDLFIRKLASNLNRRPKKIIKSPTIDDYIKDVVNVLVEYKDEKQKVQKAFVKEWLEDPELFLTWEEKKSITKQAFAKFRKILKNEELARQGWLDPNSDETKKFIEDRIAEMAKTNPTIHVADYSLQTDLRCSRILEAFEEDFTGVHLIVKIRDEDELNRWLTNIEPNIFQKTKEKIMLKLEKDLTWELAPYKIEE